KKTKSKTKRTEPPCRIGSVQAGQSTEQLIDLGTLPGLIELYQLVADALLLGLTHRHHLTVQGQQILHAAAQLLFITARLEHGAINGHTALQIQLTNGGPILLG